MLFDLLKLPLLLGPSLIVLVLNSSSISNGRVEEDFPAENFGLEVGEVVEGGLGKVDI